MSIEIRIIDPASTSKDELRKLATMLLSFAGDTLLPAPTPPHIPPHANNAFNAVKEFVPPPPATELLKPVPVKSSRNSLPSEYAPMEAPPVGFTPVSHLMPEAFNAAERFKKPEMIPAAPVVPPPPPTGGIINLPDELDAKGLPWDSRIHARTRSKNADGTWKLMRGIDMRKVQEVEMQLASKTIEAPVLPKPYMPPLPQGVDGTQMPVYDADLPPVIEEEFLDPITYKPKNFNDLMTLVTSSIQAGKLSHAIMPGILKEFGLPALPVAATRPDLIEAIIKRIEEVMSATP